MKEKNSKVKFSIEKIEGNPVSYLLKRAQKEDKEDPDGGLTTANGY
jgi:hypothetical protein